MGRKLVLIFQLYFMVLFLFLILALLIFLLILIYLSLSAFLKQKVTTSYSMWHVQCSVPFILQIFTEP
jgi:hypothetical protein